MNEDVTNLSASFIDQFKHCPFVSMLELIEHLDPSDLEKAETEIFGKLGPTHAFITTPNIEYNEILTKSFGKDRRYGELRHFDHKFEWNRKEFHDWCNKVSERFGYTASIRGIGSLVDENANCGEYGFASHAVLFTRGERVERIFESPKGALHTIRFDIKIENNDADGNCDDMNYENEDYFKDSDENDDGENDYTSDKGNNDNNDYYDYNENISGYDENSNCIGNTECKKGYYE